MSERLTEEQIAELERLEREATPGPWAWFGNTGTHTMHLATTHSGRVFVLAFRRWGMSSAQPYFKGLGNKRGFIVPATDHVRYEVDYRKDIAAIDHPDAKLIAAFRAALPSLLAEVRASRAILQAARAWRDAYCVPKAERAARGLKERASELLRALRDHASRAAPGEREERGATERDPHGIEFVEKLKREYESVSMPAAVNALERVLIVLRMRASRSEGTAGRTLRTCPKCEFRWDDENGQILDCYSCSAEERAKAHLDAEARLRARSEAGTGGEARRCDGCGRWEPGEGIADGYGWCQPMGCAVVADGTCPLWRPYPIVETAGCATPGCHTAITGKTPLPRFCSLCRDAACSVPNCHAGMLRDHNGRDSVSCPVCDEKRAAPPTTTAATLTFVGAGPCPTCGGAATGCRQVPTPAIACTGAGTWIPPGERAVYRCAAAHEWPPAAPPTTPAPGGDPVLVAKLLEKYGRCPAPAAPPTTPAPARTAPMAGDRKRPEATSFDAFIQQIEAEAHAAGPDAIAQLEEVRAYFRAARRPRLDSLKMLLHDIEWDAANLYRETGDARALGIHAVAHNALSLYPEHDCTPASPAPPATPPPAAPGPGTGEDFVAMCISMPGVAAAQIDALRARALKAEAERDEAKENEVAAMRAGRMVVSERDSALARASAAEASLLALRDGVRQPLADAEEQLRIFRASLGGPDAPACNKLNRAIEGVAKVRAALGGDDGTGTGHEGGAR